MPLRRPYILPLCGLLALGLSHCGYIDYDYVLGSEEEPTANPESPGPAETIAPTQDAPSSVGETSINTTEVPGLGSVNLELTGTVGGVDIALTGDALPAGYTVEIRRQTGSAPGSLGEGTVVCSDCALSLSDGGLTGGQTYFYAAFILDAEGAVVGSVSGSATPVVQWGLSSTQEAYFKASNPDAGDFFGDAVDISGDGQTLVVGADEEESAATGIDGNEASNVHNLGAGAAYVFVRSGPNWVQQAYIKASNTDDGDTFGHSVALSEDGNTLAIGAYNEDSAATGVNGNESSDSAGQSGAVYVFTRSGTTWSQQAYLKASNTEASDIFGSELAISGDGDTLVVGAAFEGSAATGINGDESSNGALSSGAAYVFVRNAGTWMQQAYVKASNTDADDIFGSALAVSHNGNTLAVGAYGERSSATGVDGDQSSNATNDAGAVYVFERSGTTWAQQAYLKASNPGVQDFFGNALTLSRSGNTLAVGARWEDSSATGVDGDGLLNDAAESGAAYVFERSGSTWSQEAYLKASNAGANDRFGWDLAMSDDGNTLAVSAWQEDSSSTGIGADESLDDANNAGAIYLFGRVAGSWSQSVYLKSDNSEASDLFGTSVAISGDGSLLAVGARGEDGSVAGTASTGSASSGASASGACYLFNR